MFRGEKNINLLWTPQPKAAPLRRLFLDLLAAGCDLQAALKVNGNYNTTFLKAIILALYEMKKYGEFMDGKKIWKHPSRYYVFGADNPLNIDCSNGDGTPDEHGD